MLINHSDAEEKVNTHIHHHIHRSNEHIIMNIKQKTQV